MQYAESIAGFLPVDLSRKRAYGIARLSSRGYRRGCRLWTTSGRTPLVAMVQAADFRERDHTAFGRRLHASWRGRVLLQREVRSRPLIIENILAEHVPQMRFAEDDEVIEALAAS
jgi:hypothetical protein